MPWLFIDTCERGLIRLASLPACRTGRPARGRIRSVGSRGRPGSVVRALASFISPAQVANLNGVCVVAGPGSFSAVRGGVLVANLLSRLHGLPLYALSRSEAADLRLIRARLVSGDLRTVPYAAPVYDAEPNITCQSKLERSANIES